MTHKMVTLTKQAKERWSYVPPAEQKSLVEDLQSRKPGTAVIELDKPQPEWKDGQPTGKTRCKAQIVNLFFGMDIARGSEKRYLFLSDIPKPTEEASKK